MLLGSSLQFQVAPLSKSIRIRPCYWPRTSPSDQSPVSDRHAHTHICGKTRARHNFPIQIAISRCRLGTYVQLLRCNCLSCLARAKCGFLKSLGMGRGGRPRARMSWAQTRGNEAKRRDSVRRRIRSWEKRLTRPCVSLYLVLSRPPCPRRLCLAFAGWDSFALAHSV